MKAAPKTTVRAKAPAKRPAKPRSVDKAAAKKAESDRPLRPQIVKFIDEYLIDLNGTQAAIRAGYSPHTANEQAARLLASVRVRTIVEQRKRDRQIRTEIDQDEIVRGLLNEVAGDRNKLVQYRRPPCRCCYGKGFRYQFTPNEMEEAREKHAVTIIQAKAAGVMLTPNELLFDEKGGLGFDPRKEPNPDCPECFGEGKGEIFVQDTRKLDPDSLALYDGVERGKDGLKLKMPDRAAARTLLMRHAGMLNDKLKLQGDAENPLIALIKQVSGTGLKPVADPSADD